MVGMTFHLGFITYWTKHMKKTLVTLLAAASCSGAFGMTPLSLEEVTTAQLAENPTTSATVAMTLNIEALESIAGSHFTGTNSAYVFFNYTGTWGNGVSGRLGLCNAGSSSSHITGIYAYSLTGSTQRKGDSAGLVGLFTPQTDWSSFEMMSLVCSMVNNEETGTVSLTSALSIRLTDGSTVTYGGESVDIPNGAGTFTASGVIFASDYVETSSIYTGTLSLDEAKTLSASLVPEPTTATLSLLALAGLAARRRRK